MKPIYQYALRTALILALSIPAAIPAVLEKKCHHCKETITVYQKRTNREFKEVFPTPDICKCELCNNCNLIYEDCTCNPREIGPQFKLCLPCFKEFKKYLKTTSRPWIIECKLCNELLAMEAPEQTALLQDLQSKQEDDLPAGPM